MNKAVTGLPAGRVMPVNNPRHFLGIRPELAIPKSAGFCNRPSANARE
jgi:hypothetical protein